MNEEACSVCGQPDNCGDCTHVFVEDPSLSLWYTGTVDSEGVERWYRWWAEDKTHAVEQSKDAWPDEKTVFALKAYQDHTHNYRADIADWWCDECDTVTDYCQQNNPV